jgi:hypothetical protein
MSSNDLEEECNNWAILKSLRRCDLALPPTLNLEEFLLGEENPVLLPHNLSSHVDRAQNCSEGNSRGSLDIVIKSQQLVAVSLEDGSGMRSREVFPLQGLKQELPGTCLQDRPIT